MAVTFRNDTVKNISLGFAIGVVLCLLTFGAEAMFSSHEFGLLF